MEKQANINAVRDLVSEFEIRMNKRLDVLSQNINKKFEMLRDLITGDIILE